MAEPMRVVAVFAANPALTSILAAVLAATRGLRVRSFESQAALLTYMQIAAVDLVVADFDCAEWPAPRLARALRADTEVAQATPVRFEVIALASTIVPGMQAAAVASGIDEVIVKPMSPKYLVERVLARLRQAGRPVTSAAYFGPERRQRPTAGRPAGGYAGNVIPLFGDRRAPTPAH